MVLEIIKINDEIFYLKKTLGIKTAFGIRNPKSKIFSDQRVKK